MRKRVLGAYAQIGLRIRTVWPGSSLSANKIIGYYIMFQWREMPGWDFAHVQGDVNPHFLCMLEDTFSLDEVQIMFK